MDATAVIGIGRSGQGAARLLAGHTPTVVVDSADSPAHQQRASALRAEGIVVHLGCPLRPESILSTAPQGTAIRRAVLSPGIPWDHPCMEGLRARGIEIDGELVVAWESMRSSSWIGITGTNGKTTVTHLLNHVLTQAGLDAPMCGNVGYSATELALERRGGSAPEVVVAEMSSYQIEAAPCIQPTIGVWTTLTPDHLDRHGTLDAYRAIKRGLLERSSHRILNADDPDIASHADSWDHAHWVTTRPRESVLPAIDPALWVQEGSITSQEGRLMPLDALAMRGGHNAQNMLLCCAAALALGVPPTAQERGFRSFSEVPHRLERIRVLGGLTIYNDSKATNFDAAKAALAAIDPPAVVLAGGQAKTGDPAPWLKRLKASAAAIVLYGSSRQSLAAQLVSGGYEGRVVLRQTLAEAVEVGFNLANSQGCRTLLLSPACASFDQFRDFEDRGEQFRRIIEAL